jgi:hypothetical protein
VGPGIFEFDVAFEGCYCPTILEEFVLCSFSGFIRTRCFDCFDCVTDGLGGIGKDRLFSVFSWD